MTRAPAWLPIVLLVAAIPALARAYPPPPDDCPPGTAGAIGGFCVPMTCASRDDCTATCTGDALERAHCALTIACVEEELCVEEVPIMYAGPYPTSRIVGSCATAYDPEHGTCRCAPRGLCRTSVGRVVAVYGTLGALPVALAAVALVARRRRR